MAMSSSCSACECCKPSLKFERKQALPRDTAAAQTQRQPQHAPCCTCCPPRATAQPGRGESAGGGTTTRRSNARARAYRAAPRAKRAARAGWRARRCVPGPGRRPRPANTTLTSVLRPATKKLARSTNEPARRDTHSQSVHRAHGGAARALVRPALGVSKSEAGTHLTPGRAGSAARHVRQHPTRRRRERGKWRSCTLRPTTTAWPAKKVQHACTPPLKRAHEEDG